MLNERLDPQVARLLTGWEDIVPQRYWGRDYSLAGTILRMDRGDVDPLAAADPVVSDLLEIQRAEARRVIAEAEEQAARILEADPAQARAILAAAESRAQQLRAEAALRVEATSQPPGESVPDGLTTPPPADSDLHRFTVLTAEGDAARYLIAGPLTFATMIAIERVVETLPGVNAARIA